jgi:hypothetical protein
MGSRVYWTCHSQRHHHDDTIHDQDTWYFQPHPTLISQSFKSQKLTSDPRHSHERNTSQTPPLSLGFHNSSSDNVSGCLRVLLKSHAIKQHILGRPHSLLHKSHTQPQHQPSQTPSLPDLINSKPLFEPWINLRHKTQDQQPQQCPPPPQIVTPQSLPQTPPPSSAPQPQAPSPPC